ncbi:MAG TPA: four helix bundle protein [Gemmatimonadaceae bacterium]|jgi:four helix bundle protein
MHDFRRLVVWQRSRELAIDVDALTKSFPRADRGVVGGQLRRAALSIAANVAEGCGKSSRKEAVRFLQIASGSAHETEHHLIIAADLGYLPARTREKLTADTKAIQRMLVALIAKLPA